jgi:hemolysin D
MSTANNNPIEVLIVDDRRTVCEQVKAILQNHSDIETIGTANDGQSALDRIEVLQPDVILMDIDMPGLDGLEASKIITEKYPDIKVIVLSGYDDPQTIARSLSAGATGYLVKAKMDREIAETIRCVHRGYTQLGPGVFDKLVPSGTSISKLFAPKSKQIQQIDDSRPLSGEFVGDEQSKFNNSIVRTALTSFTKLNDWSNSARELIDTIPLPWTRGLLYFVVLFMAGFVPWACLYQVDEIGTAQGRLEPKSDTIKREADINDSVAVTKVHVKKGERVKAGQTIMELDNKNAREQLQQGQLRLSGLEQRLSQLLLMKSQAGIGTNAQAQQNQAQQLEKQAQIAQAEQNFNALKSGAENQRAEKLAQVRQAEQALSDRQSNFNLQQEEKLTQIRQADQAVIDAQTAVQLSQNRLTDAKAEEVRYGELLRDGAISQIKLKELEGITKERNQLLSQSIANLKQSKLRVKEQKDNNERLRQQGQADITQAKLRLTEQQKNYERVKNQTSADIDQARLRLTEQQRGYQSVTKGGELAVVRNNQQLKEIQGQIVALEGEIEQTKAQNSFSAKQLEKYRIVADVDGTIFELPIAREGSVVQPKQLIAEIAPEGKATKYELVFKGEIMASQSESLRSIDTAKENKPVKLKFDEFPFEKYDIVPGKMTWISPNSKLTPTPQGNLATYDIKVELEKNCMKYENKCIPFKAGQPATAEIIIRRRKIIDFILDPFKKLKQS